MVRTEVDLQGPTTARASIAGGFLLVPIPALMAAWRACRVKPLGIGDFRAWLAAREMVARRCGLNDGRQAAYTVDELAGLLGITRKRAGASLKRLEAAGLIRWSETAIVFPDPGEGQDDQAGDQGLGATIGRGRGSVAIPRRLLRHLADGARPALIATSLAVLLRCLTRRKAGFDGRGRLKAGWIAQVFRVDLRAVKRARRELIALGWIAPEESDAWSARRWGAPYRIDLAWSPPAAPDGPPLPPIPAAPGPAIATPRSDQEPLRERIQNQEPVSAGPAGVQLSGIEREGRTPPEAGPLPPPRLDDVRVEDLKSTGRLLELHGQAVARGLVTSSECDRLRFASAAEHALAVGKDNPPGLFAYLVRGRCWRYATQADEDRAAARLRAHDRPPTTTTTTRVQPAGGGRWGMPAGPGGPSDAEIVRAVREATIRAGIYRDPWPEFARIHPGWDRARWDRATDG